jgi:hypothetical protein
MQSRSYSNFQPTYQTIENDQKDILTEEIKFPIYDLSYDLITLCSSNFKCVPFWSLTYDLAIILYIMHWLSNKITMAVYMYAL